MAKGMTKEELIQISDLRKEVKRLQDKLLELNYGGDGTTIVSDKVRGSMSEYPYSARSFNLIGREQMSDDCIKKRNEIAKKLSDKYHEQLSKISKAMDYINSIDNSEIRTILSYKYIDGLSDEQIGEAININDRTVRRKIKAWFENR